MEKDYSLLRPFDPEAAKRGEPICLYDGRELWDYVAGPDAKGRLCLSIKRTGAFADTFNCPASGFRMAPLCWVEGKPVYKGDVLYQSKPKGGFSVRTAGHMVSYGKYEYLYFAEGGSWATDGTLSNLTWAKPEVKREVRLVAFIDDQGSLRWVREELFRGALVRVPSEDKVIVLEE